MEPLLGRLSAWFARLRVTDTQTDRQTHETTAVTFAAHARRGLINKRNKLKLGPVLDASLQVHIHVHVYTISRNSFKLSTCVNMYM